MYPLCLHAGTPLGDPIEVGAALEQLLSGPAAGRADGHHHASLHLLGAKSFVGHAEPAAGILGLGYAMSQVGILTYVYFMLL